MIKILINLGYNLFDLWTMILFNFIAHSKL
jgi:hypothetical protein